MQAEIEVYVFAAIIVLLFVGVIGGIADRLLKKKSKIFGVMQVAGIIGLILIPIAMIIAFFKGTLGGFLSAMFTEPFKLLSTITMDSSYSGSCVNGICSTYCCENSTGDIFWKDCAEDCSSKIGARGIKTGDDCQYDMDREAVCKLNGVGGTVQSMHTQCNYVERLGPVTCTCCRAPSGDKWWDCDANCSSHPETTGSVTHVSACSEVHRLECNSQKDVDESKDWTGGNSQSY
jgi:hypothetical protein